jgi:cell division protein FtsI (penicillin-binding protein 3)
VEILGEGETFIKSKSHADWSCVSLPMISMGYELMLTPLQVLTFYNGIANDGKVVKPRFVKELQYRGNTIQKIRQETLNSNLCSHSTLKKIHELLCGVVENGTANNLKNPFYKIAGKTGTAQIPDKETGYRQKSRITYQASFVGYFPADNPKYTCIVVINSESNDIYYGRVVAGTVFLEIDNTVFARQLEMHNALNSRQNPIITEAPFSKSGFYKELNYSLKELDVPVRSENGKQQWVSTHSYGDSVRILPRSVIPQLVPNVLDMGLKDGFFCLKVQD